MITDGTKTYTVGNGHQLLTKVTGTGCLFTSVIGAFCGMIIAGKSANEHGVPVIFDPVGAGATPFRTESAQAIMRKVKVSAVRGNAAEIANTLGEDWLIKGVDGELVRKQKPLVHNMTNNVVTNFTANGLLALGASPVMAYAREEAADMAKIAGALVLNIGTLSRESVEEP
ncbi:hypothetical protein DT075_01360 [Bacillus licheniformis]|nr:hypothetical protein DT075_01360 [Bacillus licheniformis]